MNAYVVFLKKGGKTPSVGRFSFYKGRSLHYVVKDGIVKDDDREEIPFDEVSDSFLPFTVLDGTYEYSGYSWWTGFTVGKTYEVVGGLLVDDEGRPTEYSSIKQAFKKRS